METAPRLRSIEGGASTVGAGKREPYGLAAEFERAAVTAVCRSPSLFSKIGSALDPECFGSATATMIVKAAQEFARELGKGPGSVLIVVQRLCRWRDDGKLKHEKVLEAADYFDAAEDAGIPSDEAVIAEIAPILQKRAKQAAIRMALEDFSKGEDLSRVEKALAQARSIGRVADSDGAILGGAAFEAIDALRLMERLPTGIGELDLIMDGGFPRGFSLFVGDSGAGKSMALAHCAAEAVYQQLHVGVVTLELAEEIQLSRIIANLTGTPINDLLQGRQQRAKDRLSRMVQSLGTLTVRYFAPRATRAEDLYRWVEQREQKVGRKMDVLIVDYIDKLGTGNDESTYKAQGDIADSLRDYSLGKQMWCLTASQAKRGGGRTGKTTGGLDLHDIADSMGKPRVADAVITLRKDEEQGTIDLFLAKHRLGKARLGTGPLTQDEACGRIVTLTRSAGW